MPGVAPSYSIRSIATLLILLSLVAFFIASWRHRHLHINRDLSGVAAIPSWVTILISSALIIAALIALIGIWSLGVPTSRIVD